MREPGDGLQRLPKTSGRSSRFDHRPQRLDGVTVAVHRMPLRDQAARFGEQEKEDAIDDGQRVIDWIRGASPLGLPYTLTLALRPRLRAPRALSRGGDP